MLNICRVLLAILKIVKIIFHSIQNFFTIFNYFGDYFRVNFGSLARSNKIEYKTHHFLFWLLFKVDEPNVSIIEIICDQLHWIH
jgi:hypothetical protein